MIWGRSGAMRFAVLVFAVPVVLVVGAAAGALAAVVMVALAVQLFVAWPWRSVLAARDERTEATARRVGRGERRAGVAARVVVLRMVPAAVGCLVLLVALDWCVGALWNREAGPDDEVAALDLAGARLPHAEDQRVHTEALADAPWADRYFAEMEALDFDYVPFIGPREAPVHGNYINSVDGVRRSYEPPGADGDGALEVWFFGGSTLWGEGQRDLHTIPSEVARLAEADGVTLRVFNYGVRGYTAFQELLVFEQELARRGPPDLAVFYHGFNELSTQTEAPENLGRQPTIFQLRTTTEALERAPVLPQGVDPGEPSVRQEYVDTSVLTRLWRGAGSIFSVQPAAADVPFYQPPPEDLLQAVDNAEEIYRRTFPLIEEVADGHDVRPVVFWQPSAPTGTNPAQDDLTARVGDLGIDISRALDDAPAPIYIDGVHTNELGAELSAQAIWQHLGPIVAGLDQP